MMRRLIRLLAGVACLLALAISTAAADEFSCNALRGEKVMVGALSRQCYRAESSVAQIDYYLLDGEAWIIGYTHLDAAYDMVMIPEYLDGYPVRHIENELLKDHDTTYSLVLPGTLQTVAADAFDQNDRFDRILISGETEYFTVELLEDGYTQLKDAAGNVLVKTCQGRELLNTWDQMVGKKEDTAPFAITSVKVTEDYRCVITWRDEENNGPYEVTRKYYVPDTSAKQVNYWASSDAETSTVSDKTLTTDVLCPGMQVNLTVTNAKGEKATRLVTMPVAGEETEIPFQLSSLDVSVEYSMYASGQAKKDAEIISGLSAAVMNERIPEGDSYGLRYTINASKITRNRMHMVLQFIAPDGFTVITSDPEQEFKGNLYWYCAADNLFSLYRKYNGDIKPGEYTVRLFVEGRPVNTSTFTVDP